MSHRVGSSVSKDTIAKFGTLSVGLPDFADLLGAVSIGVAWYCSGGNYVTICSHVLYGIAKG